MHVIQSGSSFQRRLSGRPFSGRRQLPVCSSWLTCQRTFTQLVTLAWSITVCNSRCQWPFPGLIPLHTGHRDKALYPSRRNKQKTRQRNQWSCVLSSTATKHWNKLLSAFICSTELVTLSGVFWYSANWWIKVNDGRVIDFYAFTDGYIHGMVISLPAP